jgi:uncharacterized protein involved in outer membrane biogenesis
MVSIDTLRLRIGLWPLLRGALAIEQAEVSGGGSPISAAPMARTIGPR